MCLARDKRAVCYRVRSWVEPGKSGCGWVGGWLTLLGKEGEKKKKKRIEGKKEDRDGWVLEALAGYRGEIFYAAPFVLEGKKMASDRGAPLRYSGTLRRRGGSAL